MDAQYEINAKLKLIALISIAVMWLYELYVLRILVMFVNTNCWCLK